MNAFQWVFAPLSLLLALWAFLNLRSGRLPKWQGVFWISLWVLCAVLIAVPASTTVIAKWLGIGRGSDLVFYLAILGGLWACLHFYRRFRRLEMMLTELIRREAIKDPKRGGQSDRG
jgi:hypothetical protein